MTKIITLEGTFNTRDMGGIMNEEGKYVRYNRMIRSDALNKITNHDVEYLEELGLKTIVVSEENKKLRKHLISK